MTKEKLVEALQAEFAKEFTGITGINGINGTTTGHAGAGGAGGPAKDRSAINGAALRPRF